MAGIPLNTFKTVTSYLQYLAPNTAQPPGTPTPPSGSPANTYWVYTAPPGTTGIVLYMQVANISANTTYYASAWHYRAVTNYLVDPPVTSQIFTTIVNDVSCPVNDARVMLGGKLVLETGDQLYVAGSDNTATSTSGYLQLLVSILESANQ
jgi:hypothetical protein